jgi:2'-5' RNA ligase
MGLRRKAGSEVARWTPPHELVLTLCPLGELNPLNLQRIPPAIAPVFQRFPPMTLSLEGIGGSPSATQPRIVWVGVSGEVQAFEALHQAVEQALMPLGLLREVHAPACHIPIGRLRTESEIARSELGRAVRMANPGTLGSWRADSVEYLKSDVGPYGPTLVTLAAFPLGG